MQKISIVLVQFQGKCFMLLSLVYFIIAISALNKLSVLFSFASLQCFP